MKVEITYEASKFTLYREGKPYFIRGIGGSNNLELAKEYGANSLRTWGSRNADKILNRAYDLEMTVMLGITMSKNNNDYLDDKYKNEKLTEVENILIDHKDHPALLIWTIGNEINLGTNSDEAWIFVNDIAKLIKNYDQNHPVCTVIAGANIEVLNQVTKHCPEVDVIGINAYAADLPNVRKNLGKSNFSGPCIITEWGPYGHWEVPKTSWSAPIEQTSNEKATSYRKGYQYIEENSDIILGSYVFLWGQKEERTPTWYGLFVETNEELGLKGELCPTVDVMKYNWTGSWPSNQAPNLSKFTLNELEAKDSIILKPERECTVTAFVSDPDGDILTYKWEILLEATKLGHGGSYEPRPERVGNVIESTSSTIKFIAPESGKYRVYVYALDNEGHVATANIPFLVEQ